MTRSPIELFWTAKKANVKIALKNDENVMNFETKWNICSENIAYSFNLRKQS